MRFTQFQIFKSTFSTNQLWLWGTQFKQKDIISVITLRLFVNQSSTLSTYTVNCYKMLIITLWSSTNVKWTALHNLHQSWKKSNNHMGEGSLNIYYYNSQKKKKLLITRDSRSLGHSTLATTKSPAPRTQPWILSPSTTRLSQVLRGPPCFWSVCDLAADSAFNVTADILRALHWWGSCWQNIRLNICWKCLFWVLTACFWCWRRRAVSEETYILLP